MRLNLLTVRGPVPVVVTPDYLGVDGSTTYYYTGTLHERLEEVLKRYEDTLSPYHRYILSLARHYGKSVHFKDDKINGDLGTLLNLLNGDRVRSLGPIVRGMINVPVDAVGHVTSHDSDHYYVRFDSGPDEVLVKCKLEEIGRCF